MADLPLNIEFAASCLDGVMECESSEIRKWWKTIREFLSTAGAAEEMLEALKEADRFMGGFEGDEMQDGIDAKLASIRSAIAAAEAK